MQIKIGNTLFCVSTCKGNIRELASMICEKSFKKLEWYNVTWLLLALAVILAWVLMLIFAIASTVLSLSDSILPTGNWKWTQSHLSTGSIDWNCATRQKIEKHIFNVRLCVPFVQTSEGAVQHFTQPNKKEIHTHTQNGVFSASAFSHSLTFI